MAFEIVDGMTGTKHISSDDLSALNVATIGKADCVLKYGDDFKLTMASANSATLGTGVGMVGGKRFWNQAATSLTVQSGTQGQKRNDLVVARYAKTSAGIESITPVVIKGTPTTGTAADPDVTANDLKLWRVPLDGISVGDPVKLFEPVASLATLGDSVSQISNRVLLWSGTAGKGANITINNKYTFKEFKSFYCLTSIDKTIGLPLVRNYGIQEDQHLHGITGWDDGNTTYTLTGLIKINTETTATVTCISKHDISGNGGVYGNLLKLWGYY